MEKARKGPMNYFRSIYFSMAILVCLTSVLVCVCAGYIAQKTGTTLVVHESRQQLHYLCETASAIEDTGESLAVRVFCDKDLVPLLYSQNPQGNEITVGLRRLENYCSSASYIHSIYVYNGDAGDIYSTLRVGKIDKADFTDQDIVAFLNGEKKYNLEAPIPRVLKGDYGKEEAVYTFICCVESKEGTITNAVIINISQEWLSVLLKQNDKSLDNGVIVIDSEGRLCLTPQRGSGETLGQVSQAPYIGSVLADDSDSGYFVQSIGGDKMMVAYEKVSAIKGWTFIRITSYSQMVKPITKSLTFIFVAVALVSGMMSLSAFFISKRIYRPIKSMETSYQNLRQEFRTHDAKLRNIFLQSVLTGTAHYTQVQLESYFEKYHVTMSTGLTCRMVLFSFDGKQDLGQPDSGHDQELYCFAIVNIGEELGRKHFECDAVVLGDSEVAVIGNAQTGTSEFEAYAAEVQEALFKWLELRVSAVVSEPCEDASRLHQTYAECKYWLKYRLFLGDQALITGTYVRRREKKAYQFPTSQQESLLLNLKAGRTEEVKTVFHQILQESAQYSYNTFISAMHHISYDSYLILNEMMQTRGCLYEIGQGQFMSLIEKAQSMDEVEALFSHLFSEIEREAQELQQEKKVRDGDALMNKVMAIINTDYGQLNICIQSIADRLEMSPAYLGRIFKKNMHQSITECITARRMSEVCRLLTETDIPISDISERCGFGNITYFYRIFKKIYNVTPFLYRSLKGRTAGVENREAEDKKDNTKMQKG